MQHLLHLLLLNLLSLYNTFIPTNLYCFPVTLKYIQITEKDILMISLAQSKSDYHIIHSVLLRADTLFYWYPRIKVTDLQLHFTSFESRLKL